MKKIFLVSVMCLLLTKSWSQSKLELQPKDNQMAFGGTHIKIHLPDESFERTLTPSMVFSKGKNAGIAAQEYPIPYFAYKRVFGLQKNTNVLETKPLEVNGMPCELIKINERSEEGRSQNTIIVRGGDEHKSFSIVAWYPTELEMEIGANLTESLVSFVYDENLRVENQKAMYAFDFKSSGYEAIGNTEGKVTFFRKIERPSDYLLFIEKEEIPEEEAMIMTEEKLKRASEEGILCKRWEGELPASLYVVGYYSLVKSESEMECYTTLYAKGAALQIINFNTESNDESIMEQIPELLRKAIVLKK
jgi:hypothetical protein